MLIAGKTAIYVDLVAYVDGGSQGNPGPSGIGVVLDGAEQRQNQNRQVDRTSGQQRGRVRGTA